MSGLPVVKLELDDGTGTWPYDISKYVDLKAGYTVTHGRQDEFGTVDASTLSIVLKNDDGRFTLGKSSPTYPLKVGMPVRLSEEVQTFGIAVPRFDGYVNAWPVEWPGGKKSSKANVTASNRLARLARRTLRGSVLSNEIRQDSPDAYFPLTDAAGSDAAIDVSGNLYGSLVQRGTGTAVSFGSTSGLGSDSETAADFAAGRYLSQSSGPLVMPSTTLPAVVLAFATSSGGAMGLFGSFPAAPLSLFVDITAGVISVNGSPIPGSWADGLPHILGIRYIGTNSAEVYVDGTLMSTLFGTPAAIQDFSVGAIGAITGFVGQIAHVAIWKVAPSATRMYSITGAFGAYVGETTDERIARLAGYGNIAAADLALEVGVQRMGAIGSVDGVQLLDAMREAEAAEQGLLFVDPWGDLTFHNRSHRYAVAPTFILGAENIDPSARVVADDQGLFNRATISRPDGTAQTYENAASVADLEEYPYEAGLSLQTDDEAFQIAAWIVNNHGTPVPRMSSAKFDLLTAGPVTCYAVLGQRIGDAFGIDSMPSQNAASSVLLFCEGWVETVSLEEWSVDFNTSPYATGGQVFQLDVTPLDSDYRLAL